MFRFCGSLQNDAADDDGDGDDDHYNHDGDGDDGDSCFSLLALAPVKAYAIRIWQTSLSSHTLAALAAMRLRIRIEPQNTDPYRAPKY